MTFKFISKAAVRSSKKKKKKAPSIEPPPPDHMSASSSTFPEKKVKDYYVCAGRRSPSITSEDSSSTDGLGNGSSVSEDASKYMYGDASPDISSQEQYRCAAGDAAPSDCGSSGPSKTTRRSSGKQRSRTGRRPSTGCTSEIEGKLPGRRGPIRRRASIHFPGYEEVKETEHRVSSYGDESPEIASQEYGYSDAAPSDCGSSRASKTARHSSMKQRSRIGRRASIGFTGDIEVKLPGRRDPVRRRTSISFSGQVRVKEVERISSLIHDPKALWFQKDELNNIQKKMRTTIGTVERGDENAKKLCTRGLECHIGQSTKTKMNAAWDAVVIEQYMQKNKGSFDEDTISRRYKSFSKGSQQEAAKRAKEDEAAIAKYQRDTRRMMSRMSI